MYSQYFAGTGAQDDGAIDAEKAPVVKDSDVEAAELLEAATTVRLRLQVRMPDRWGSRNVLDE